MSRAAKSTAGVAFGVLLIVAGVYGWFGENSILLAGVGLLVCLLGLGALITTQSRAHLTTPHPAVYVPVILAIAFHLYENVSKTSGEFAYGWFIWALVPYGLVLGLACFAGTRIPAVAGAVLALLVDIWIHYEVAQSTSSTAVLAFIWIPLWNTIIVVPAASFLTWLLMRHRKPVSSNAP
jgi:hypothetical protein